MYCSVEDVREALTPGGVSSPGGDTAASLRDDQIEDAITQASGRVDLYLSQRYVTPVVGAPDATMTQLKMWTRDLAAYLGTLTKRKAADIDDNNPVIRRYKNAINDLQMLRDNQAQIDAPLITSTQQDIAEVVNLYAGTMFWPGDYSVGPDRSPYGPYNDGYWPADYGYGPY